MVIESIKAVGSTRLPPPRRAKAPLRRDGGRRVRFGVPPNCIGAQTTCVKRMADGDARRQKISGAPPETTRETRVLPHFSPYFRISAIK